MKTKKEKISDCTGPLHDFTARRRQRTPEKPGGDKCHPARPLARTIPIRSTAADGDATHSGIFIAH